MPECVNGHEPMSLLKHLVPPLLGVQQDLTQSLMGRRKIKIEKIKNERSRKATFAKRKAGIFKKAWEFGVLTSSKVHLIIEDIHGSKHSFTTDKEDLHFNYNCVQPANRIGPEFFDSTTDSGDLPSPTSGDLIEEQITSICRPASKPRNLTTNTGDGNLYPTDDFTMGIVKDCIEVAASIGGPGFLTDCFPTETNFLHNSNLLGDAGTLIGHPLGGKTDDFDQMSDISRDHLLPNPSLSSPMGSWDASLWPSVDMFTLPGNDGNMGFFPDAYTSSSALVPSTISNSYWQF